jgi:predicted dehydrogenase
MGLRVRTTLGHVAHRLRRSIGPVGAGRAYQDYYTQFAAALRGGAAFPVPATEAVRTLEVLDAARTRAEQNRLVDLPAGVDAILGSGSESTCEEPNKNCSEPNNATG